MTALQLFRLLHGPGDGGSELAFNCRNPVYSERLEKLARWITKLERERDEARVLGAQLEAEIDHIRESALDHDLQ